MNGYKIEFLYHLHMWWIFSWSVWCACVTMTDQLRFSLRLVLGPRISISFLSLRRRRCLQSRSFQYSLLGRIFLQYNCCVWFWMWYIRNVWKRWWRLPMKREKKQHSKTLFSMLYSVVKNHRTRSSANFILYISFFAYLVSSRLVSTNFHYYFSFYTL